ncbi:MAG: DUF4321 domain-containing protein [Clostridiales bacterium]|jgi:F0F1-type ATP synthase assembly protein I|nr:DUF4321 domain-containing protein [Clostridiales bacterium]
MRRGNSRSAWTLLLFIFAGIIIGSVVGNILAQYFDTPILNKTIQIGTKDAPWSIDLAVISLALGFTLTINFGTVLGVLLGILFYLRS